MAHGAALPVLGGAPRTARTHPHTDVMSHTSPNPNAPNSYHGTGSRCSKHISISFSPHAICTSGPRGHLLAQEESTLKQGKDFRKVTPLSDVVFQSGTWVKFKDALSLIF